MSIEIALVQDNKTLYLASDERVTKGFMVEDGYTKIAPINDSIYFGMAGTAKDGVLIYDKLRSMRHKSVDAVLAKADHLMSQGIPTLSIVICGYREDGNFFIWRKTDDTDAYFVPIPETGIAFNINLGPYVPELAEMLTDLINENTPIADALAEVIRVASSINPGISPESQLVVVTAPK